MRQRALDRFIFLFLKHLKLDKDLSSLEISFSFLYCLFKEIHVKSDPGLLVFSEVTSRLDIARRPAELHRRPRVPRWHRCPERRRSLRRFETERLFWWFSNGRGKKIKNCLILYNFLHLFFLGGGKLLGKEKFPSFVFQDFQHLWFDRLHLQQHLPQLLHLQLLPQLHQQRRPRWSWHKDRSQVWSYETESIFDDIRW